MKSADPEILLTRLRQVRKRRTGHWMACCPAHDDRSPSLSISEGTKGNLIIHCFAGCEPRDVLSCVGLTYKELFPLEDQERSPRRYERVIFGRDAVRALCHEVSVLQVISSDFGRGIISQELCKRAALASDRILTALEMCDG